MPHASLSPGTTPPATGMRTSPFAAAADGDGAFPLPHHHAHAVAVAAAAAAGHGQRRQSFDAGPGGGAFDYQRFLAAFLVEAGSTPAELRVQPAAVHEAHFRGSPSPRSHPILRSSASSSDGTPSIRDSSSPHRLLRLLAALRHRSRSVLSRVSSSGGSGGGSSGGSTSSSASSLAAAVPHHGSSDAISGRASRLPSRLLSARLPWNQRGQRPSLIELDSSDTYEAMLALDQFNVVRAVRPSVLRALPGRRPCAADAERGALCAICCEAWVPVPPAQPAPAQPAGCGSAGACPVAGGSRSSSHSGGSSGGGAPPAAAAGAGGAAADACGCRIVSLPCRHEFCRQCLATWLKASITCPVCRWAFPEADTRLLHTGG